MRVVLQRVSRAEVRVDGRIVGRIGGGLLLLVGFKAGDGKPQIDWMADKVLGLRVFRDEQDKMNRSLEEAAGDVLVVSQFTLYGDVAKGRRPSFVDAAPPDVAKGLYGDFVSALRSKTSSKIETGEFGAMMEVDLVNDGPVTLMIDRDA